MNFTNFGSLLKAGIESVTGVPAKVAGTRSVSDNLVFIPAIGLMGNYPVLTAYFGSAFADSLLSGDPNFSLIDQNSIVARVSTKDSNGKPDFTRGKSNGKPASKAGRIVEALTMVIQGQEAIKNYKHLNTYFKSFLSHNDSKSRKWKVCNNFIETLESNLVLISEKTVCSSEDIAVLDGLLTMMNHWDSNTVNEGILSNSLNVRSLVFTADKDDLKVNQDKVNYVFTGSLKEHNIVVGDILPINDVYEILFERELKF